jgi:hypothetical protein
MIELSFLVRLAAAPADCRTGWLRLVDVPMRTCALGGQAQLASWREGHPGWEVRGWICRDRVSTAKEL